MSLGALTKFNTFSTPFKIAGGDSGHNRLFIWGRWGKEDNELIRVSVDISFETGGPWFPYHEGNLVPVENDKGEIEGDEIDPLILAEDDWRVLKDISGLYVRLEVHDADEETKLSYRLI
jgi:hypothetical protein